MQTRIVATVIVVSALLLTVAAASAQDYITQSIPRDAPYYTDLQRCYQLGLLEGYEDGTYRPDCILTRAELWVAFNRLVDIARMRGMTLTDDWDPIYATYARGVRDHWGIMSFERLLKCGLIEDPPMPNVRGFDQGIKRIEFADIAVHTMRAYGMLAPDMRPAELAIGTDIMVRQSDGNFHMQQGMPRWEFAVAMDRLLNVMFPAG
ncbi:MAG TPA: S-layer homology domain-containing protein [Armatimonadota bacterium]|nr:S-layer homology domain-containing protein [Armatimonadota bacterium]